MKLTVRITTSEDGMVLAECPLLPGCRTSGETRADALAKLEEAIRGYLAAVGNFVPDHVDQFCVEA